MKNATDLAIVGAIIAGLAAGCYAQMNGYFDRYLRILNFGVD